MTAPTSGQPTTDQLVDDYLRSAARAFAGLPPERAAELLADLGNHIAEERAALDPETPDGVRDILHRLGDPQLISAEASSSEELARPRRIATAPVAATSPGVRRARAPMWLWLVVAAVGGMCVLLMAVGVMMAMFSGPASQQAPAPAPSPLSESPAPTNT